MILSVVWAGGKLGMSYYVSDTAHLYMMHDTTESVDYELLHRGTWIEKKRELDFLKEKIEKRGSTCIYIVMCT